MSEIWTVEQWRAYEAKRQGKKGQAIKSVCFIERHHHGSKMEAAECDWHFARVRNKEIARAKWQITVEIRFKGKLFKRWKIDFAEWDHAGNITYWETKGYNFSDRDYVLRRDAFLLANPAAKLYVNRVLWTGRAKRKSVKWRMQDVARTRKRQSQASRDRRDKAQKWVYCRREEAAKTQAVRSGCAAAKAASRSPFSNLRTPQTSIQ